MLTQTYLIVGALTLVHTVFWYCVALLKKRNDVADVAWGLGFLIAAAVSYGRGPIAFDRGLLVMTLVAIWALRLSLHIYLRNRGRGEDYRYQDWHKQWSRAFCLRTFFQVFLLQWLLMLLVSLPVLLVNVSRGGPWGALDLIGAVVWMTGFYFEAVGDWQLARFSRAPENKGKILQTGLWGCSRHPNYFGEVVQWWGLALIALSVPDGWLGLFGAATITFLLLKVSGIPMLEKRASLKAGWTDYTAKTPKFWPRWPGHAAQGPLSS